MQEDTHDIPFTRDQFRKLLRIVYLGNWLVNAHRDNSKNDPRLKEFDEIEEYIFSQAHRFGFKTLVERDKDDERWLPTRALEESLEDEIDSYDDETFWEEMFYRLADRDFFRSYGEADIRKMSLMERFEKEQPFRDKWADEIDTYGLERIDIIAGIPSPIHPDHS
ncbi:hypothetical protein C4568_04165 [Candidatus Parcubacteria bacterium]|nr:MAG: hypothetical protein C4568_04165 [Candidatus Parcubacteria bacterium]